MLALPLSKPTAKVIYLDPPAVGHDGQLLGALFGARLVTSLGPEMFIVKTELTSADLRSILLAILGSDRGVEVANVFDESTQVIGRHR